MYNPSRGGVRGGADQFTWETVKNDKHRENYLGHSLMAPVGRWQKGKDLSWYAKERGNNTSTPEPDKSELASIKKAEEEAMLIALGHNIVRKTQQLSKEDIQEALKRNASERDEYDIERVDGVGASSKRVTLLSGGKDSKQRTGGVVFESHRNENPNIVNHCDTNDSLDDGRKRSKKKSKKHKKHKKHQKESDDSDSSDSTSKIKTKNEKNKSDFDSRKSSKIKTHKKSKHKYKHYSSDESKHEYYSYKEDKKRHKKQSVYVKRHKYDSSKSD